MLKTFCLLLKSNCYRLLRKVKLFLLHEQ